MKHNQIWFKVMVTAVLLVGAGCQDSSSSDGSTQSSNQDTIEESHDDSTNEAVKAKSAENENKQDDTSGSTTSKEASSDQSAAGMKEKYLKKLNETDKEIEYMLSESDASTTLEMEEEQTKLFNRWDQELNEVYGVLKEELPEEVFAELREEQRIWIAQRDEKAKKASKKYEGGTMESLEYTAAKTELTKERTYELVAKYMK